MAKRKAPKQQNRRSAAGANNNKNKKISSSPPKQQKSSSGDGSSKQYAIIAAQLTVVLVAIICVYFQNYPNDNAGVVTLSMINPMDRSEEELMLTWGGQQQQQVDQIPFNEMTHERFYQDYLIPRRPVVIQGAYTTNPLADPNGPWSFSNIRKKYGNVQVPSYMVPPPPQQVVGGLDNNNSNCSYVGLCNLMGKTLAEMFDESFLLPIQERRRRIERNISSTPYIYDLNLLMSIPDMFNTYRTLSFFGNDNIRLQYVPQGLDNNKPPSLFLGPAGTKTGLHVDLQGTSFTMVVFQGRKQFVLFDATDAEHLCMDKPLLSSRYGIDPFEPDFNNKCPNARKANPLFVSVGAGDILYVPGTTIHAERNLEDTIGIGQNFLTTQDYLSFLESGPMGFEARQIRINDGILQTGVKLESEFFAMRDLFHLLNETNYFHSPPPSSENEDIYLHPEESRILAYERVIEHIENVLETSPNYATRIAMLCNNRLAILAMKTMRVWDCLDTDKRDILFVIPHNFPKDDTRERLHHARKTCQIDNLSSPTSPCQIKWKKFLEEIEIGLKNAGTDILNDKTLSSYPSSWRKASTTTS